MTVKKQELHDIILIITKPFRTKPSFRAKALAFAWNPPLGTSYYPYSIPLLLLDLMHNFVAGAAEFSKLFPPARNAGFIYPPREALFVYTFVIHRRWIIFLFYKVNEIVPPPAYCQVKFLSHFNFFGFFSRITYPQPQNCG